MNENNLDLKYGHYNFGIIQGVRKRLYLFQKFNQCNLHHSPHTEHLEKKIKKGSIFFGHIFTCRFNGQYEKSFMTDVCLLHVVSMDALLQQ